MALTFGKLAAILLVAATGINAAPASAASSDTVSARDADAKAVILNGDFGGSLSPWTLTKECGNSKTCPSTSGLHLVKSNGNYVAQIDSIKSECKTGQIVYSVLKGTIENLEAGKTYDLSFDYKFSDAVNYPLWQNTNVGHAYTNSPKYTKAAKANQWYPFSIQVHAQKSGTQTLSVDYFNCPNEGTPPPTVQLDNFKIVPLKK